VLPFTGYEEGIGMSFNPLYFYPTIITSITELNGGLFGTVKGTDVYPAVDVTDVTQSPSGTTKPYQVIGLLNFLLDSFGFVVYQAVIAASTTNLNATYNNGLSGVGATLTNAGVQAVFSLDGILGVQGGLYLIKDQTNPAQNGLFMLSNPGSLTTNWVLTRAVNFNQVANIFENGIVYVSFGAINGGTFWQDTFVPPMVVGTTAINWAEWSFVISPQLTWHTITTTSVNLAVQNGYVMNRNTQIQALLPAVFNVGDEVLIRGLGVGGFAVIPNIGQTIEFAGGVPATVSIPSDIQYCNMNLRGIVANTTWTLEIVNSNPDYS